MKRRRLPVLLGVLTLGIAIAPLAWLYGTAAGKEYRLSRLDAEGLSAYAQANPADAGARRRLGDALLAQGKPFDAVSVYGEAAQADPDAVWPLVAQARAYLEAGQMGEAQTALQEALRRAPEDADANAAMGEAHYNVGNLEMARQFFQKAAQGDKNNAEAQAGLAMVAADGKNYADARAAAKRAAEIAPHSGLAYRALGYAEAKAGNAEGAVRYLTLATEKEPNRGQTWGLLTAAWTMAARTPEDYRKAAAAVDRAEELLPGAAAAPYHRGLLLMRQNRRDEAIAEFRRALERDPNATNALYQLAAALALTGEKAESAAVRARFEKARDYERQMTQLQLRTSRQPERADLWRRLKALAEENGDKDAARIAEQRLQSLASGMNSGG